MVDHVLPGADIAPGAFALVAMAATFGASTRATFTAIVFVFELTRDYDVILPLMLATVLADLVFDALSEDSIMTEKLHGRGLRIGRHYGVDPLEHRSRRSHHDLAGGDPAVDGDGGEARDRFVTGGHGAYPIVDGDGGVVGIVTRGDVLGDDASPDDSVLEVASRDVVSVAPDAPAVVAMNLMIDESIEHVPVIAERPPARHLHPHRPAEGQRRPAGARTPPGRAGPRGPADPPVARHRARNDAKKRRTGGIPVVQVVLEALQAEAPSAAGVDLGPGQGPGQTRRAVRTRPDRERRRAALLPVRRTC